MTLSTPGQSLDNPYLLYPVTVSRIEQLSPTFRRFTFAGPDSTSIADTGYDQRIKLAFPLPGEDLSRFPMIDNWFSSWRALPNEQRPPIRTYTLRNVKPGTGEFDVDVALHGRLGPASTWASDAKVGDEIIVAAPNSRSKESAGGIEWNPPAGVRRVLLAGDETAAPAVAGILERLDEDAVGAAVVELPDAADAVVIGSKPPGIELVVLERGSDPIGSTLVPEVTQIASRLLTTLSEHDDVVNVDEPGAAPPLYVWIAGEAVAIKTLRRSLLTECGIDRHSVTFMGYWRAGRAESQ